MARTPMVLAICILALSGCAEATLERGGADCMYRQNGDNGEFRATANLDCDGALGSATVGPIACQDLEVWMGYDVGAPVELRLLRDGQEIRAAQITGQHQDGGDPTWEAQGEAEYRVEVDPPPDLRGELGIGMVCDA